MNRIFDHKKQDQRRRIPLSLGLGVWRGKNSAKSGRVSSLNAFLSFAVYFAILFIIICTAQIVAKRIAYVTARATVNEKREILAALTGKGALTVQKFFDHINLRVEDFFVDNEPAIASLLGGLAVGDELQRKLDRLYESLAYGGIKTKDSTSVRSMYYDPGELADIDSVVIFDAAGKCVMKASLGAGGKVVGDNYSWSVLYREAKLNAERFATTIEKDAGSGRVVSYVTKPLFENGVFAGLIAVGVRGDQFARTFMVPEGYYGHAGFLEEMVVSYVKGKPVIFAYYKAGHEGEEIKLVGAGEGGDAQGKSGFFGVGSEEITLPEDIFSDPRYIKRNIARDSVRGGGDIEEIVVRPINVSGSTTWYLVGKTLTRDALKYVSFLERNLRITFYYAGGFIFLQLAGISFLWMRRNVEKERYSVLLASEERYRSFMEGASDLAWKIDIQSKVTFVNPAVKKLLGYEEDEVVGKNIRGFLTPKSFDLLEKTIAVLLAECERAKCETTGEQRVELEYLQKGNAGTIWCEVIVKVIRGAASGEAAEIMGVSRDICMRKKLQESLIRTEKMAAIGAIAANVAHDLRNPLGVIKVAVFNLKHYVGEGDERVLKHLDNIEIKIKQASDVIDEVMNYANQTRGSVKNSDINTILTDVLDVVSAGFYGKHIRVIKELGQLPLLNVDPFSVAEALRHLLTNAYESMGDEGILTVGTMYLPENKKAQITISDTGCGMSPEQLEHIDKPFLTVKKNSTGLGLALVYKIIRDQHHGSISVQSEKDIGTVFTIVLPLV